MQAFTHQAFSLCHESVKQLLSPCDFAKRTCDTIRELPREVFYPDAAPELLYSDRAIELIDNRYALSFLSVAKFLEAGRLSKQHNILVIAGEAGYFPALCSLQCNRIVVIEENGRLFQRMRYHLVDTRFPNIALANQGHEDLEAPSDNFDKVFILGCVDVIPKLLLNSLVEGGTLFSVKSTLGCQRLMASTRRNGGIIDRDLGLCEGVELVAFKGGRCFEL